MNRKDRFQRFALLKRESVLLFFFLIFIWCFTSINFNEGVFHPGGATTFGEVLYGFFHPDLSSEILLLAILSLWRTLAYAVAGMSLALVFAFVTGILASGILFKTPRIKAFCKGIFRGVLGFMRAIHELIWAWLFVAAIGLSPYAAIFALAIPYGGMLGKIFADQLEDVAEEPINALYISGATRMQELFYGYFPMAATSMISYTFYRFECAVRSSAIMSFVGLGGIGYQIQLSLDELKYDQVWTFIFILILLVVLIEIWSNQIRKRIGT